MLPTITAFGITLAYVVAGVAIVEIVFSWPGTGSLMMNAIMQRDYPLLMGLYLLISSPSPTRPVRTGRMDVSDRLQKFKFNRPLPETRALMNIVDQDKAAICLFVAQRRFRRGILVPESSCTGTDRRFSYCRKKTKHADSFKSSPKPHLFNLLHQGCSVFSEIQEHYDYLEQLTGQPPSSVTAPAAATMQPAKESA